MNMLLSEWYQQRQDFLVLQSDGLFKVVARTSVDVDPLVVVLANRPSEEYHGREVLQGFVLHASVSIYTACHLASGVSEDVSQCYAQVHVVSEVVCGAQGHVRCELLEFGVVGVFVVGVVSLRVEHELAVGEPPRLHRHGQFVLVAHLVVVVDGVREAFILKR